jgi:hypothetical protein
MNAVRMAPVNEDAALAAIVQATQQACNRGMGVGAARSIAAFLRGGHRAAAQATVVAEYDKLRSHPPLLTVMIDGGLISDPSLLAAARADAQRAGR